MKEKRLIGEVPIPLKIELVKKFMDGDKNYVLRDGYESGIGETMIRSLTIWWEENE